MMFMWSDAWLLLSLIYARGPADRDHLRAVGDFINHAIFSDQELNDGLARLLRAGHAIEHEGRFGPTPQVLSQYASATAGKLHTSVQADLRWATKLLGVHSNA